jgi:RIO kinase 1
MADDDSIDLMGGGFTRGMLSSLEQKMVLESFSRHVEGVEYRINDGKEATVYLCRGKSPGRFMAAKVYRDRRFRGFAGNANYTDTRKIRDRRMAKAVRKGSRVGRKTSQRLWVDREWQALHLLFEAGASVPRPLDRAPDAVLMEYLGDRDGPAPMLAQVSLPREAAQLAWTSLMEDVEILLAHGLIHGDLSAYNVLYQDGRARLIDLPQAVDVDAADAWSLLTRDLDNLAGYFRRQGLEVDAGAVAIDLWSRYVA